MPAYSYIKFVFLLFLVSFVLSRNVRALASDDKQKTFLSSVGADIKSPVSEEALPFTLSGGIATLSVLIFGDHLVKNTQTELTEDKPLGKFNKPVDLMGQLVPNGIYMLGMFAYGNAAGDNESLRRSSVMFRATLYSSAVTNILKYTIREPRPNNSDRREAFPSGHTTSAFAFASVVAFEHGWLWGTPAFLMATLVGVERMNDNKHRLQDVVAGAAIGIAYGAGIHYTSKSDDGNTGIDSESEVFLLPTVDLHGIQLGARHSF